MAYGTANLDVIQSSVANTSLGAGNASIMKNRIINGAMVIDQRNAGASGTASSGYPVDRWQYQASQASKVTWQQNAGSVTPPSGFKNYLGITSSSAYSVLTGDYFFLSQTIEGYNIADLGWGAAGALTVTLSFWVRSSLTGTFGGAIRAGGFDVSYPFTYTISSANTWEQKSITIAGPTSGTFGSTNGNGLQLDIGLGAGSTYSGTAGSWAASNVVSATGATSVVGTNGATFYITGVQLEVGSSATGYEYRPYSVEYDMCRRYCEVWNDSSNNIALCQVSPNVANTFQYQGTMAMYPKRAAPSVTTGSSTTFVLDYSGGSYSLAGGGIGATLLSSKSFAFYGTSASNMSSYSMTLRLNAGSISTNYVIVSAEL